MKYQLDKEGNKVLDEEGNPIPIEENDEDKNGRASDRIRTLVGENKILKDNNSSMITRLEVLENTINSFNDKKNDPEKIVSDKIVDDSNELQERLKLIEANQFSETKNNYIESNLLTEDMLEGITTLKDLNKVVKMATSIKNGMKGIVDDEANKKAKVIIAQQKAEFNGDKKKKEDRAIELKSSLKKLNLL